jgi:hypothetical protein
LAGLRKPYAQRASSLMTRLVPSLFRGQQTEIDPTRLIPEAQFHLVLHGQIDGLDLSHIRPAIIVDL